jgi:hypothetical protein
MKEELRRERRLLWLWITGTPLEVPTPDGNHAPLTPATVKVVTIVAAILSLFFLWHIHH